MRLRCFNSHPFYLVVGVDVAVLAHALGVVHAVCVFAILSLTAAAVSVIAVVTHTFGEVFEEDMGAFGYDAWLTARPRFSFVNLARAQTNIDVYFLRIFLLFFNAVKGGCWLY